MTAAINRRQILKGGMLGIGVAVGIPLLECMLDFNGEALAATGGRLPVRFGTWHWGCGMNAKRWTPSRTGADYDIPPELQAIAPYKDQISVLSGFNVKLDGRPNESHVSGVWTLRTGTAPINHDEVDAPSLDVMISDVVGAGTRFRSVDVAATGSPKHTFSRRGANVVNASEPTPLGLYQRLFGTGFVDPNVAEFKPDPAVILRRSVLSGISEQRQALIRTLGAADRQRMDEYFTSVRQLEDQLELQLQQPPRAEACVVPTAPPDAPVGTEIEQVVANHKLMANMLVMALACNQTRVFNMVFSDSASSLRKPGSPVTHHTLTHEEPIDATLGYQPQSTWFVEQSMSAWGEFVGALAAVKEGAGTLLDNCLVYAHSDTSDARVHALEAIPVMIAGRAGGRIRSGLHIDGKGDPVTRTGLTAMQVMGVPLDRWGTMSMETSRPITELMA